MADAARRAVEARQERDELIVQALRAGAGLRTVASIVGMSYSSVREIGLKNGWPDEKETRRRKAERDAAEERRAAWAEFEAAWLRGEIKLPGREPG